MSPPIPALAYPHEGRVYLNITSRCPTACVFCAKYASGWTYEGIPLALSIDPTAREIIDAAEALLPPQGGQAVFCGFGEPTERLDVVLETAGLLRARRPGAALRLNTVGLGSLIAGEDIAPRLAAALDSVSISLNTADRRQWLELHRPRADLAEKGFDAVCRFIESCARAGLKTRATAVISDEIDLVAVEALARSLGASFQLRPRF